MPPQAPAVASLEPVTPPPCYTPTTLPFNSRGLNSEAVKRGGEIASHILFEVAQTARSSIEHQEAKTRPGLPPAGIAAAKLSAQELGELSAEDYWLNFDAEGRREKLDQLVREISKPNSAFALFVADQPYEGQSLIERGSNFDTASELVTSSLGTYATGWH